MIANILRLSRLHSYNLGNVLYEISVRNAGHSHWKNIAHTKAAKDLAKNQMYNRYIRKMKSAIWANNNNSNPESNGALAAVIESAKEANMSMDTINRFLTKFQHAAKNIKTSYYEFRGPCGILILISALTDNKLDMRRNLNQISKKYGLTKADGTTKTAFMHKAHIIAEPPTAENYMDKAIEDAIEVDAEEVEPVDEDTNQLRFVCDIAAMQAAKSKLERKNYKVVECSEVFIARAFTALPESDEETFTKCLEELQELDDVEGVFSNVPS